MNWGYAPPVLTHKLALLPAIQEVATMGDAILLSEKDVSEKFGFTLSWLRAARVRGSGPRFAKVGTRVFYRLDDLLAFVDERMVRSTSEVAKNGR